MTGSEYKTPSGHNLRLAYSLYCLTSVRYRYDKFSSGSTGLAEREKAEDLNIHGSAVATGLNAGEAIVDVIHAIFQLPVLQGIMIARSIGCTVSCG